MTDSQRHLFAHKLSTLHEMSEYSVGTESYEDFAKRIANMLLEPENSGHSTHYWFKLDSIIRIHKYLGNKKPA
jgi:hypothetical protein